jgi:hypothetical protein
MDFRSYSPNELAVIGVRRAMIQFVWRFLKSQKDSALATWFQASTENTRGSRCVIEPLLEAISQCPLTRSRMLAFGMGIDSLQFERRQQL